MPPKNSYELINPCIRGSFNSEVKASNSFNAGKKLYDRLADKFNNHVKSFNVTILNKTNGVLTHFKVEEKMDSKGLVNFDLTKLNNQFSPELEKKLVSVVHKTKAMNGGKKENDLSSSDSAPSSSDDSSDSSSDEESLPARPIDRFTYFHLPYYKLNIIGLSATDTSRLFVPMFGMPINPVFEIRFDLYQT